MRLAAALVLLAASRAVADDAPHAFVEVEVPQDCYVHQPVRVRLRVGVDRAWFDAHVVSRFLRPVDVPVQVEAPWWGSLPWRGPVPDTVGGSRLAVGEDVVGAKPVADVVRDGRTFAVVEVARELLPLRPGEVAICPTGLRFAETDAFDDDALGGRVARNPRDVVVTGEPRTLRVLPLPEEGRPRGFSGAVGRFDVRAETDRAEVDAGASLKLVLRIEGAGNVESFDPPRLDGLRDFRVLGVLDRKEPGRRTFTYDVVPEQAGSEGVPPIAFASFDPGPPPGYRVTQTAPIPLVVRAAPPGATQAATPNEVPAPDPGSLRVVLVIAAVLVLGALALLAAKRRGVRRRAASEPSQDAAAAFRRRCTMPGVDVADAFVEYLATKLGCAKAAVVAPDLARRLAAAGVSEELAARAARSVETLVAARFGGDVSDADRAAAVALVGELDAAFARR